jgi:hypothetical protein
LLKCRVLAGVLLVALLAGPLVQAQNSRAQSEITIRQLEQKLAASSYSNDWQFWDQVVAPGMDVYRPIWPHLGQAGHPGDVEELQGAVQSAKLYDVQVRFFKDDVAMVTGTLAATGSVSGKSVKTMNSSTDILAERGGKWLVVASQATPVKELR